MLTEHDDGDDDIDDDSDDGSGDDGDGDNNDDSNHDDKAIWNKLLRRGLFPQTPINLSQPSKSSAPPAFSASRSTFSSLHGFTD